MPGRLQSLVTRATGSATDPATAAEAQPPAVRSDQVAVPSRDDPLVRTASQVIGGPLGRYATPLVRGWRYYAAVLAALSMVPSVLSVWVRSWCMDAGWNSPDQFWHACFSDIPVTYRDAGLSGGMFAWLAGDFGAPHPTQPPLTAFVMSVVASLVPDSGRPATERMVIYFALWAVLSAVLLALTTWWTAATVRRFPLRAAHVALSPVVVLVLVISPDMVGVALTAAGLYAWSRSRLFWCGVLLGLAVTARTYPLVVLLALFLVCLRAGRVRDWARVAGAAALTIAVVLLGLAVLNPDAAAIAYRGWADLTAGFGSPWLLPQLQIQLYGPAGTYAFPTWVMPAGAVTALAVVGWLLAAAVGALFALGMPRRPGVAEVSLVMLGIVMVTGKSMPVQSALWLVPFIALVGLSWRDHLLWAAAEALHFEAVWLYLAGVSVPNRGLPAGWYGLFLVLRLAGVLWLVWRTWSLARGRPPVRDDEGNLVDGVNGDEETDEVAGPLRGAPDQLVVRFA